jgi:hypothetical protein
MPMQCPVPSNPNKNNDAILNFSTDPSADVGFQVSAPAVAATRMIENEIQPRISPRSREKRYRIEPFATLGENTKSSACLGFQVLNHLCLYDKAADDLCGDDKTQGGKPDPKYFTGEWKNPLCPKKWP